MKKPSSSDSIGILQEKEPVQEIGKYEDRVQFMMDAVEEVECEDEEVFSNGQSAVGEKKRRLSVRQVKTLEKSFEVENKLNPDRKARLAQDLCLQPRQVAIWFQNRRARWKTKQLERDYGALRARYETLKTDCDALRHDKEKFTAEIKELKAKLANSATIGRFENKDAEERPALMYKDGASDSDSSVVFNDEHSTYSGVELDQDYFPGFKSYSSSSSLFEGTTLGQKDYLGEGFLSEDKLCSALFSEEHEANLSWYCSEGWE